MKNIFAAILVTSLSGCAGEQYLTAVSGFDEATTAAVVVQKDQLEAFYEKEAERIRTSLAESRVELRIKGCADLVGVNFQISDCQILRFDGEKLEQPFAKENILALGAALADYSSSLGNLAADASEDADAFSKSLSDLAVSLGGLDGAIVKAGGGSVVEAEQLGAVATIIAEAGNLYFEQSRVSKLKKIIIGSDPFVQEAASLLSAGYEALRFDTMADAFARLNSADESVSKAVTSGASSTEIRKKHDALFAELAEFRTRAAIRDSFSALGEAHNLLAEASKSGASSDDLKVAILRIIESAQIIKIAAGTLIKKPE